MTPTATARVHIHAPGARPPRGEWRGGGTGTAPPPVRAAWAPLSPQRGRLGARSVPTFHTSSISSRIALGRAGDCGLREALRLRAETQPRTPPCAAPLPAGQDPASLGCSESEAAWLPGSVPRGCSPPGPRLLRVPGRTALSHGLGFPSSPSRLSVTTSWTSAVLKVQQAWTESDPLGLHASRRLTFLFPGHRGQVSTAWAVLSQDSETQRLYAEMRAPGTSWAPGFWNKRTSRWRLVPEKAPPVGGGWTLGPVLRCCSLFVLFPPSLNRWSVVGAGYGGVMSAGNLQDRVSGLT